MFNSAKSQPRSAKTRETILACALDLFRERGLHTATMRDVAKAAGVALGAAYYYFPSKEAIIQAYYDEVQRQHHAAVTSALSEPGLALLERLQIAFHTKLDIVSADRQLLGALFRYTGEPEHPLSVFGPGTRETRVTSTAVFELAVGEEELPQDIRAWLPTALWALHLGVLLFFIYDESENQHRTRSLVDGTLAFLVRALGLASLPLLKPLRNSVLTLLQGAGLMPLEPGTSPLLSAEPQENPS